MYRLRGPGISGHACLFMFERKKLCMNNDRDADFCKRVFWEAGEAKHFMLTHFIDLTPAWWRPTQRLHRPGLAPRLVRGRTNTKEQSRLARQPASNSRVSDSAWSTSPSSRLRSRLGSIRSATNCTVSKDLFLLGQTQHYCIGQDGHRIHRWKDSRFLGSRLG